MKRDTQQRRAIVAALERAGRPLGPREVLQAAAPAAPGLGIATVYRTLKALLHAGLINPVHIPGQSPRYEPAGKRHHHYFRCRGCDHVFEIAGCPGNLEPLVPRGFVLEDHEVVLYGLCAKCGKRGHSTR